MSIDCHYHLDETILPISDLLARMDTAGIIKTALMANMCGPLPIISQGSQNTGLFLLSHTTLRAISKLFYHKFTAQGNVILPGGMVSIIRDPDNQPVFDAIEHHPDKFLGWIFVNPRGANDQMQEFTKWADAPGVVGVKAHPHWHRFAPIDLLPVAEYVASRGKPMLLHLGFNEHGDYKALLKAVPDLKLILAHAAFPYYATIWKEIKDLSNVYVDLSQTSYVNETITKHVVRVLGEDRCLFGTDGPTGSAAPNGGGFDPGVIKRRIEKFFPDKNVQDKLLGENFMHLVNG